MKAHFLPGETLERLRPQDMGLVYGSAQRVEVGGAPVEIDAGEEELCLTLLEGQARYSCGGQEGVAAWRDMLYVPLHGRITLEGGPATLVRFGAPCSKAYPFAHIRFEDVDRDARHKVYGKAENGTLRDVWNYIDESFPSGRFLTGICFGRDGGWTAWPPHEHGAEREEIYVYFGMGDGFGVQCVYDELGSANAYAVQDGHLVAIPGGYHPNCGCPKGGIRYVYCMVSTTEGDREFMNLRTQRIFGDRLE